MADVNQTAAEVAGGTDLSQTSGQLVDYLNQAVQDIYAGAVHLLPGLIAAIIVFVLGWFVAGLIAGIVGRILKALRFEQFLKTHKLEDALGTVKLSDVLSKLVKYYVWLIFLQAALSLVELGTISAYLTSVLLYVPLLITAVIIVLVAVLLGEYAKEAIIELSKSPLVKLAARATKFIIAYIGVTIALSTAGIPTILLESIFVVVLGAVVFGLALGVGIAFGLGGQEDAKDVIKRTRKHFKL